jgi:hypothetical protein
MIGLFVAVRPATSAVATSARRTTALVAGDGDSDAVTGI